jgi:hypothetical protein
MIGYVRKALAKFGLMASGISRFVRLPRLLLRARALTATNEEKNES